MRHRKKDKRLSRHVACRKALINNLVKSVIKYQKIETTLAKAKLARQLLEKLITKAKQGGLNSYRSINQVLNDRDLTMLLVNKISPRFKNRNGGYTRIVHLGTRQGDNSSMVALELVIKEEKPKQKKVSKKSKKQQIKTSQKPEEIEKQEVRKVEAESNSKEKEAKEEVEEEKKPRRFVEGLRKFFKRKRKE